MRITLISVSSKQPDWVRDGYDEYARRLRGSVTLNLAEREDRALIEAEHYERVRPVGAPLPASPTVNDPTQEEE